MCLCFMFYNHLHIPCVSLHCRDITFSNKLRFVVYKYGMQQRTDELAFNTMWRKYASAKNKAEMKFILCVIGQTRNMSHVRRYVSSLDTVFTLCIKKTTLKISHITLTIDKLGLRFDFRGRNLDFLVGVTVKIRHSESGVEEEVD